MLGKEQVRCELKKRQEKGKASSFVKTRIWLSQVEQEGAGGTKTQPSTGFWQAHTIRPIRRRLVYLDTKNTWRARQRLTLYRTDDTQIADGDRKMKLERKALRANQLLE